MSIKTVIEDTAALARKNAVVGGTKTNSIQTTGGTIVGEPLKMDTFQNHNLPTLWSLKAARGQRYRHFRNDGDKHIEYPGLYVYLGYNYATALESVQIKNNWIADGTHPSWLVYADFLDHTDEGNDRIYTYKVNAQGEVDFNTPFEVGTGRTKQTVLDAFMGADYKTVDGWYELPCPACYASPLYAVCFSGPSFVPCLAFISVNSPVSKAQIESPEGMDSVASYKFHPDFSKFHQWAQNWDDSYHGLIGSPRMVVDENPYCTDPDAWFDKEPPSDDWRWGIFATGTTMEFIDTVDTYNFGFRPMLSGPAYREDGFEQWNYSFVLEFQPPANWVAPEEVGPTTDTIYKNGGDSLKPEFVKTISAQEGTLYKVRVLHNNGFENTLYLLDPSDGEYEALGVDRTANIVFREDKCDLVTQKGEEIALIVESDYEGGYLDNIVPNRKLMLVLTPIMLANTQTNIDAGVGGVLAYYPQVLQSVAIAVPDEIGKFRLPEHTTITACEILAGGFRYDTLVEYSRKEDQETNGPYPYGAGENEWRLFGNLCPKYKSIPLEGITNNTPGDSLGGIQPEQVNVSPGADNAQGKYYGQNGSIDLWTSSNILGGARKSYYSLYEFADAPFSDVTKYYQHAASGGGDPTPLEPGESIDGKDVEPKTDFGLIARVKNTKDQGEVPAPSGTTQTAGYHLEYIDFQSLRKGHWITGGDDITNYGKSLAFDDGTSRITITIVS